MTQFHLHGDEYGGTRLAQLELVIQATPVGSLPLMAAAVSDDWKLPARTSVEARPISTCRQFLTVVTSPARASTSASATYFRKA